MLTRRETMMGAVSAAALMETAPSFAQTTGIARAPHAALPSTPVNFDVPADACDCHTHIFGEVAQFPLAPGARYTPPPALPDQMAALHRALHVKRVVMVNASVYGTDNSVTLYGIKARGADARGIAVIDDKISEADLDAYARAGIRGVRLFIQDKDPAAMRALFQATLPRVQRRNWHIQVFAGLAVNVALKDLVLASPVPVVFDHFGSARAEAGVGQPGFSDLLEMVRSGNAYVKITGPYQVSKLPDFSDIAPLAQALVAANPRRIVWGTDWPHPGGGALLLQIDDGQVMNLLPTWVPDAATRKTILVDNPARLYQF